MRAEQLAAIAQAAKEKSLQAAADEQQWALAATEKWRQFKDDAMRTALSGQMFLVLPAGHLNRRELVNAGFLLSDLRFDAARENFLCKVSDEAKSEVLKVCDSLQRAVPLARLLTQNNAVDSGSFFAFIEWWWRDGKLDIEKPSADQLITLIASYGVVDAVALDANRSSLQTLMEQYQRHRHAQERLATIRSQKQKMPVGSTSALMISWEAAGSNSGRSCRFGAQMLNWIATEWGELRAALYSTLSKTAAEGSFEYDLLIHLAGDEWEIDNPQTSGLDRLRVTCPSLLAELLARDGYRTVLVKGVLDEEEYEFTASSKESAKEYLDGDCCKATISWAAG